MNFKINRTHDAAFEMMVLIHINRLSSFVCVCACVRACVCYVGSLN